MGLAEGINDGTHLASDISTADHLKEKTGRVSWASPKKGKALLAVIILG